MYDPSSALKGKQAVFEAHPENAAVKALADLATDAKFDRNELTIIVARESIVTAACEAVQKAGYDFLEDVTAVDWYPSEPRFQIMLSLSFDVAESSAYGSSFGSTVTRPRSTASLLCGPPRTFMSARSSISLAFTSAVTPTCAAS